MKKVIKAMGVLNPAHNVPAHDTYSPSIDINTFKQIINSAVAVNNNTLIDGLIQQVIEDIYSDNNAGIVNNQNIRKYYHKYYDAVKNINIANNTLINQLYNLV